MGDDEFSLIRRHFAGWSVSDPDVVLGVGDDAAVLAPPTGFQLAVTADTLVAGRHFPLDTGADDIGWKSLAVNLSDLAAMGAEPRWFTLALTLPEADSSWLQAFASGLRSLADLHRVSLVGGDTTRGRLSISITAIGLVPPGMALRRDGARPGDAICVTGSLGDAALALRDLGQCPDPTLMRRLARPEPRCAEGLLMRGLVHAAIDLSDGLAGDLDHVLQASAVGGIVQVEKLPASPALRERFPEARDRLSLQVAGGDDYELCVCVPMERVAQLQARLRVPLTVVGRITAEPGLRFVDGAGATIAVPQQGYRHFP